MVARVKVAHLTVEECETQRKAALSRLGMTLDEARAQWADCGCCLRNGNWGDLELLNEVQDMDYLLNDDEARKW